MSLLLNSEFEPLMSPEEYKEQSVSQSLLDGNQSSQCMFVFARILPLFHISETIMLFVPIKALAINKNVCNVAVIV